MVVAPRRSLTMLMISDTRFCCNCAADRVLLGARAHCLRRRCDRCVLGRVDLAAGERHEHCLNSACCRGLDHRMCRINVVVDQIERTTDANTVTIAVNRTGTCGMWTSRTRCGREPCDRDSCAGTYILPLSLSDPSLCYSYSFLCLC